MPNRVGSAGFFVPSRPSTPAAPAAPSPAQPVDTFAPGQPTRFPQSADGTPVFKQNDPEWGGARLGTGGSTIGRSGCAMTAVAMGLSKLTGELITPATLDAWLDRNRGYAGDALDWSRIGSMRSVAVTSHPWSMATVDTELDAGRPVVVGVDYKAGSGGGANGTDHWVLVTAREQGADGQTRYLANDPGTGNQIEMTVNRQGRLVSGPEGALGSYRGTGQLRVFRT